MKQRTCLIASSLLATVLACLVASCSNDTGPANSAITSMELDVNNQINQHRLSIGRSALTLNETISAQARQHSQDMADGIDTLGHQGFQGRVDAIRQTIPLGSAGENVAFNSGFSDPATEAVVGWLNSPPHKENIEGDFDLTGIGIVQNSKGEYYFTQIFIKKQ